MVKECVMPAQHIRNVTYKNLGWDSSADIYLPPEFDEKKKYPAIVSIKMPYT